LSHFVKFGTWNFPILMEMVLIQQTSYITREKSLSPRKLKRTSGKHRLILFTTLPYPSSSRNLYSSLTRNLLVEEWEKHQKIHKLLGEWSIVNLWTSKNCNYCQNKRNCEMSNAKLQSTQELLTSLVCLARVTTRWFYLFWTTPAGVKSGYQNNIKGYEICIRRVSLEYLFIITLVLSMYQSYRGLRYSQNSYRCTRMLESVMRMWSQC
jgi:hypothetical protein